MSAPAFLNHVLNFMAPALFVSLLLGLGARLIVRRQPSAPALWRQVGLNFLAGLLVLSAGLVLFGRDGKMATYAALVFVCGTTQWWLAGGFKR